MQIRQRYRTAYPDYLVMVLGAAIYALSVDFFTAPNNIAPGGITGISTLLHYLLYVPIGTTALILNIPLFIWGAIESGRRFIIRTVIATALVSVLIDLFSLISDQLIRGDRIIAAIFGGILSGNRLGNDLFAGRQYRRHGYHRAQSEPCDSRISASGGSSCIRRGVVDHFVDRLRSMRISPVSTP